MSTWDEPASACLSSRIPYHSEVTEEKLRTIDAAERVLRDLGFRIFRVRHHDTIARLELGRDEIARALEPEIADAIDRRAARAGIRARHGRSARLPARQPQRGAQAPSRLVPRHRSARPRAAADLPRRAPRAAAANARRPRLDQFRARRAALRRREAPAASARLSRLHCAGEGVDRDAALRRRSMPPRRAASRSGARWPAPPLCPRCSSSSGASRGGRRSRCGARSSSRCPRCSGSLRSAR